MLGIQKWVRKEKKVLKTSGEPNLELPTAIKLFLTDPRPRFGRRWRVGKLDMAGPRSASISGAVNRTPTA